MEPAVIRGYDNRFSICELWGQAFGDESDFISHMYDVGYLKSSDIFALTVDGRLVAALFLPEYQIRVGERDFTIRLLSCVATDPMHQGKGYMSHLISRSLECVRDTCSGVCVIPVSSQLFSFYERFGFETKFFIGEKTYGIQGENLSDPPLTDNLSPEACYPLYLNKYRKDGCVYKTKERFLQAVAEYQHPSQSSEFFVADSQFAFLQREASRIVVREWVGDEEFLSENLLRRYGLPICFQGFSGEEKIPFAMLYSFDVALAQRADQGDLYLNCMYN